RALDRQATAETGERATRADDAMAGNHDGNGIAAVGEAHGARGIGIAERGGQRAVGGRLAVFDAAQALPDAALELRAAGIERQVELRARAGEIFLELFTGPVDEWRGPALEWRAALGGIAPMLEPDGRECRLRGEQAQTADG